MHILTLNAGSNSLKFEIIAEDPGVEAFGTVLVAGSYDDIGQPGSSFSLLKDKHVLKKQETPVRDYGHAAELLFQWIEDGNAAAAGIRELGGVQRVGHRIVHGGHLFSAPALIDDDVISKIESLEDLAPLHNASALQVIRAARKQPGLSSPMVAVFDTVFHQTIPEPAALYPLPLDLSKQYNIRRYGFHGISHRYMATRYAQITNQSLEQTNLVTLHLEGGSSACAIRNGKSVDNSMGFTPLEGLMMGTRCGDIDPALVTYLMRKQNLNPREMEIFLNKKCGLLGVSARSADTRKLAEQTGNPSVKLALEMFCYRVRKYTGAYLAIPGKTDAIVIAGGIGENQPFLRQRIFEDFGFGGVVLDLDKNRGVIDTETIISAPDSQVAIWVLPTQENLMMAKDVANWS